MSQAASSYITESSGPALIRLRLNRCVKGLAQRIMRFKVVGWGATLCLVEDVVDVVHPIVD